jgi:hypothetical protein
MRFPDLRSLSQALFMPAFEMRAMSAPFMVEEGFTPQSCAPAAASFFDDAPYGSIMPLMVK